MSQMCQERKSERLFDQFVGQGQQIWRHDYPELLRRLEVDRERELAGLLNRQVTGFCALDDFGSINASASETIGRIVVIAQQQASSHPIGMDAERWFCRSYDMRH